MVQTLPITVQKFLRNFELQMEKAFGMIWKLSKVEINKDLSLLFKGQEVSEGNSGDFNSPKKAIIFPPNFYLNF